ncbi:hypothetical protein HON15_04540, partial [Candidatus Woesearchaeota archaeon]|nr:hypothetical protein [Candidatus Woesearchaeota archaeon]
IFIILGIGVLFVVVVGAGYIYWKNNLITTSQEQETEQSNEQDTTTPPETNEDNTDTDTDTDTNEDDPESSGNFFDDFNKRSTDNVLNPVPDPAKTDTDQDGLSDAQEYDIGTNPRLVDSDNDGLSDWEEYAIFGTNPINSDTDSDTFLDGEEVQNGYDPNGPGKLLNIEN